ncbi:hypothetical protein [Skermanella stibiiresistens]|uniref:hypothetical protein n=1 Tax=Skermanella stibiiresistens TaxID=913326 RepID=UPI0012F79AB8|nr:hypothetical protein [Skermanella stibiiresistens]
MLRFPLRLKKIDPVNHPAADPLATCVRYHRKPPAGKRLGLIQWDTPSDLDHTADANNLLQPLVLSNDCFIDRVTGETNYRIVRCIGRIFLFRLPKLHASWGLWGSGRIDIDAGAVWIRKRIPPRHTPD